MLTSTWLQKAERRINRIGMAYTTTTPRALGSPYGRTYQAVMGIRRHEDTLLAAHR